MSADVNAVARLLREKGIQYTESTSGHEVRWTDPDDEGVQWAYFGRIYSGRDSRLCAYGIDPSEAVRKAVS